MARLSQGAEFAKVQVQTMDAPAGWGRRLVVKDIFTTFDGSWEVGGNIFSLPRWARDAYLRPLGAPDYFEDAGGATHIFARVEDEQGRPVATEIRFWTNARLEIYEQTGKKKSGWANLFMNRDSAYDPEHERGAWSVVPAVPFAEAVAGVGLPYRWHVSTFIVWQWQPAKVEPMEPPVVTPGVDGDWGRVTRLEAEVAALKRLLGQWVGD